MATGQGNPNYVPTWIYWVLGGALTVMFFLMLYLTVNVPQPNTFFNNPSSQQISNIETNPDQYIGRTVTIQAPVAERLTSNAYVIGEASGPNSATILVITPDGKPTAPVRGQNVVVTGVVRRMDLTTAQQYVPAGIDPAVVAQYSGQPAIFATSVKVVKP